MNYISQPPEKQLRRELNGTLIAYIFIAIGSFVLSFAISYFVATLAAVSNFDDMSNFERVYYNVVSLETNVGIIINIMMYVAMIFLPVGIVMLCRRKKASEYLMLAKPKPSIALYSTSITLTATYAALAVTNYIVIFFESLGIPPAMPEYEIAHNPIGFALYFLYLCILPSLIEEYASRGMALGTTAGYSKGFAIIFSALMFSLMHGNIYQLPNTFVMGICAAYFTVKYKSIWYAVIIHFVNNFLVYVSEIVTIYLGDDLGNIVYYALRCLLMAFTVLGIIMILKKDGFSFTNGEKGSMTARKCFACLFRRPLFYVFLGIALVEILLNGWILI